MKHFLNSGILHINKAYVKVINSCVEDAYLDFCEVGEQRGNQTSEWQFQ